MHLLLSRRVTNQNGFGLEVRCSWTFPDILDSLSVADHAYSLQGDEENRKLYFRNVLLTGKLTLPSDLSSPYIKSAPAMSAEPAPSECASTLLCEELLQIVLLFCLLNMLRN